MPLEAGRICLIFKGHGRQHLERPAATEKDLHRSERAGDTFTIRFSGSGARVFASLGPDRGMAAFSLDGLPETVLDLYSPEPQRDRFFYETPLVNTGPHALKVRVLGRHDALSSGLWVAANHVEVLP